MSTITPVMSPAVVTPEDLLHMPDAVNYELVDGKLVERKMGMESSEVGGTVFGLLWTFLRSHRIGKVFPADASYQCFPDAPLKVRKPDVSFIRAGRLPADKTPEGHCPIPPDLAVEVISPNDLAYEVEEKVVEYLQAGVPLVWVVTPPTRTVRIYRSPMVAGSLSILAESDAITGEQVIPGFSCTVRDFFEPSARQP